MKHVIAVVGMAGSGKSKVVAYLAQKGIPYVRFGELTDESLKEQGLAVTAENEQRFREDIRKKLGMAAYAIKAKPKIEELLKTHSIIVLDGLYSWEEYIFLKKEFPNIILICIYAEPRIRYERLTQRQIRPLSFEEARTRDIRELEILNKGGPIAIADYLIENNEDDIESLYKKIDTLLARLSIATS